MKLIYAPFALALLCLGLTGCQSDKNITRLGHGYEEVVHPRFAALPGDAPEPRVSLQHRNDAGKVALIWPALSGANEIVRSNLVLFVGDKALVQPEVTIRPRLFAVAAPALPLDLTDEVLWRWAKANQKDFAFAMDRLILITPTEVNNGVNVRLEFVLADGLTADKDLPDKSDLQLDWSHIAAIMQAVKTKGVPEKDLRWKTPYIGERY
jgi:hypothetical protein